MKALEFQGTNNAQVVDKDIPEIAADEVLIASRSVGVCHSDIELLEGRYIIPFEYPIIPGHEWSGEVAKVGSQVTNFSVGDRVVGECVIGDDHFGFSISGAAAEYFIAKPAWLHKLPDNVSFTSGALVEPFSCGYYALMKVGNVNASDLVVVLGAGPIGLGVVAAAKGLGSTVLVVEPSEMRRQAANKLGANCAVAPDRSETETLPMEVLDTQKRTAHIAGDGSQLGDSEQKPRQLIVEETAMTALTTNSDIQPEARLALLELLSEWRCATTLLYLLFYGARTHRLLTSNDLGPFHRALRNYRWATPDERKDALPNALQFLGGSNINHFVTAENVRWLFDALEKRLTLGLCVAFLETSIAYFSLVQFVQWHVLASEVLYDADCDEVEVRPDIRRQLVQAMPEIRQFAKEWHVVDGPAALRLESLLGRFPTA